MAIFVDMLKPVDQEPKDIASSKPVTVNPTDLISSALNKMETGKVYSILVEKNGKPVGLLRMQYILRAGIA